MKRSAFAALLGAALLCLPAAASAQSAGYTYGLDSATGARCLIGATPTCRMPTGASADSGTSNLTAAQVTVGSTATLIAAARPGRHAVTFINMGTTAFYVGPTSGVTTAAGFYEPGVNGASDTIEYAGALYGITASGSATISVREIY